MYKKKLEMFDTLWKSFDYLKYNWKTYIGVSLVLLFLNGIAIGGFIWFLLASRPVVTSFRYGPTVAMLLLPLIMLPMSFVSIFIKNVYIKMTDDIYEKRETSSKEQWVYTFRRSGRVLLSILICQVPITLLVYYNQYYFVENTRLAGSLLTIALNIVSYLFLLVNQSILIEDVSAVEGIKKSVSIMKHNIFRYFGFLVCIGLIMLLPMMLVIRLISVGSVFYAILVLLLPTVVYFMPIGDVFLTLLYKSTQVPGDMYKELLINEIE